MCRRFLVFSSSPFLNSFRPDIAASVPNHLRPYTLVNLEDTEFGSEGGSSLYANDFAPMSMGEEEPPVILQQTPDATPSGWRSCFLYRGTG